MHPDPVHKSSSLMGSLGDGVTCSDRRTVQSSVSGRGMRTGGRVRRSRPPNGCVPAGARRGLCKQTGVMGAVPTYRGCTAAARLIGDDAPWTTGRPLTLLFVSPASSSVAPVVRTPGRGRVTVARASGHTGSACAIGAVLRCSVLQRASLQSRETISPGMQHE